MCKNSTLGVHTDVLDPYSVCKVELTGECLNHFSVAAIRHHDQDNLQEKEFIGGSQLQIFMVGSMVAGKQTWHWSSS